MNRTRKLGSIADVDSSGFLYFNSNSSTWGTIPDSNMPGGAGSQGTQGIQGIQGPSGSGDGAGISIYVYDNNYMEEMIWEGSTGVGGGWGFTWYNSSTNAFVGALQNSTHKGFTQGVVDTSLNITFEGTTGGTPTSWVF